MKLPRRNFLHLAAGAAALPAMPYIARAQVYPSQTRAAGSVFPTGWLGSLAARVVDQWLSERLGQTRAELRSSPDFGRAHQSECRTPLLAHLSPASIVFQADNAFGDFE